MLCCKLIRVTHLFRFQGMISPTIIGGQLVTYVVYSSWSSTLCELSANNAFGCSSTAWIYAACPHMGVWFPTIYGPDYCNPKWWYIPFLFPSFLLSVTVWWWKLVNIISFWPEPLSGMNRYHNDNIKGSSKTFAATWQLEAGWDFHYWNCAWWILGSDDCYLLLGCI